MERNRADGRGEERIGAERMGADGSGEEWKELKEEPALGVAHSEALVIG